MKYWPVPKSYSKTIPLDGSPGSFWEDRSDRNHCGIDIYAPMNSDVQSIESGKIIDIGSFTSSDILPYWNDTYYVLILNKTGFICKYAELGQVAVSIGDIVNAGQLTGHIGQTLNADKITKKAPLYIQRLKECGNLSMLHFELFKSPPTQSKYYLGGNWFGNNKPKNLLNPTNYLSKI